MAMTLIHVNELLQEATRDDERFGRFELSPAFPLAMGAGAVDPDLVRPIDPPHDVEDLIAFRCSGL